MEIAGLRIALEQLRNALVVAYSLIVAATIIPGFASISNLIVLPYFLFVPGYFVSVALNRKSTLLERLFYSFAWSVAILVSVYSIGTIALVNQIPPLELVIPGLTIILLTYDHFHRSPNGA